jgi:chemotaxis protein MotB
MKKVQQEKQAVSWQTSFNDLLTLMLVFFILLVSISDIRADKVQHVSASASKFFGLSHPLDARADMMRILGSMEGLSASLIEGGVCVTLGESLLYHSGSAEIIDKYILTRLGEMIKEAPGDIRVEGHTDSVPTTGVLFPSNWELSTQRAVNVVKFLISECGMRPEQFSAAGYADAKPVATNETDEGRMLNRRVNIIISFK